MFTLGVLPLRTFAFNPNYVISDWELTNPFALDLNQIQHFLNRGFLGTYITKDWQGNTRFAADIILRAAQSNKISPKFLLVLLQKEQSLIEDDSPTDRQLDWATGYAVCDNCSKDDPAIQRWKGFGKQVNSAAMQFSEGYLADIENVGTTQGKYGPGVSITIDNTTVIPQNAATAAMYAYTPHLHGNENFTIIWDRWFTIQHPTGTLLKVIGEPGIFLVEYGYKRPIKSWSAFLSRFNSDLIIEVPKNVIDNYPDGRAINFPNYSLLNDKSGNMYLLVDDALRKFDSMDTFRSIGFMEDELVEIENGDVTLFDVGTEITQASILPQGIIMQLTTTGSYYYVEDGKRHPIVDELVVKARFPGRAIKQVTPTEIEQYLEGNQISLPDGYLVKSPEDPTVYIITEGRRRPIASESVFLSYGYSWDDIYTIHAVALNAHPLGLAIEDEIGGVNLANE